jgi:hypothetical protein
VWSSCFSAAHSNSGQFASLLVSFAAAAFDFVIAHQSSTWEIETETEKEVAMLIGTGNIPYSFILYLSFFYVCLFCNILALLVLGMTATVSVKESVIETEKVTKATGMKEGIEIEVGTAIVTGSVTKTEIATTKTGSETSGTATATGSGIRARRETGIATEAEEKGTTVTCAPKVIVIGAAMTHLRARNAIGTGRFLLKMPPQSPVKKRLPSLLKKRRIVPRCDILHGMFCFRLVLSAHDRLRRALP